MDLNQFLQTPPLVGPNRPAASVDQKMKWRAIHLDSARTFFPAETVKTVLSLMARYGFNRMTWHLTDDQGWRFAVPEYPKLTQRAAFLPRDSFACYDNLVEGTITETAKLAEQGAWSNGFYSDLEIAEIVEHAAKLGIQIIPEVDLPGHMAAAIKAYPELGRPSSVPLPSGSMREHMYWPAQNDLLWPSDESLDFMVAVLRRVAQLFPAPYLHIGGDECAYKQWLSDPGMLEWMRQHQISDGLGVQKWFTDFLLQQLSQLGKTPVAWDEACQAVGDQAIIFAWQGEVGMQRIMNSSQHFIYADERYLYFNRVDPQANPPQYGMVPGISVADVLSAPWEETNSHRCQGIAVCFWSEFILNQDMLLQMMFPRLLAVACRLAQPNLPREQQMQLIEQEYQALKEALPH